MIPRHPGNRLADNALGAVILRRVEKVDAEIERLLDQANRMIFRAGVAAHPQPARPAATESGDANFQSRFTESGVVHDF